jgi:membrane associated rhomboid family serine protease
MIAICTLTFVAQVTSGDGGQTIIEQFGMVPVRPTDPSVQAKMLIAQRVQTPMGIAIQETEHVLADSPISPWMTLISCMFLHGGWMHFLGNTWFLYIFGDNVEDRYGHFGYLAMYPHARVLAVLPIFIIFYTFVMPAPIFLGIRPVVIAGASCCGLESAPGRRCFR